MTSILYIPASGDPHGVLADGLCGAKMPAVQLRPSVATGKPCPVCGAAVRWYTPPTDQTDPCWICSADWRHKFAQADVETLAWEVGRSNLTRAGYTLTGAPVALPLVWRGEVVPEARHRISDRLNANNTPMTEMDIAGFAPKGLSWDHRVAWAFATIAARELGGQVEVVGG